ncbi:hypothetical protein Scep_021436 [Stephania cephalantha]|uniref:Uncharacterized protein n=1 Tax=Stephania cephalantha TaxID=152367 RepID=A0AAP0I083_9MAGN
MSISLEDVSMLLKIPVTGKVVAVENFARYTDESRSDAIKLVSKLLGVSIEDAEEEVNISKGLTVRKCWLKSRWCPKACARNTTPLCRVHSPSVLVVPTILHPVCG